MILSELMMNLTNRGWRNKMVDDMLFPEPDELEFMESTLINEPGDIEEINSMLEPELYAFIGLATAMNFLENNSGGAPLYGGVIGSDYIGSPDSWHQVNWYWIEKYPTAYRCLEVWVWG